MKKYLLFYLYFYLHNALNTYKLRNNNLSYRKSSNYPKHGSFDTPIKKIENNYIVQI